MKTYVALTQGIYFLITGLWPVFSIATFQKVTGPKTDLWLVKTVGVLIAAIGASLTVAGCDGRVTTAEVTLGIAGAGGLAGIDAYYGLKRVISPVYLGDTVLELCLVGWWVAALLFFPE